MKKSELMKALESYSDDFEIVISYESDNDFHRLDNVKQLNNRILLESNEVPDDDSIYLMAGACYKEYGDSMNSDLAKSYEVFLS